MLIKKFEKRKKYIFFFYKFKEPCAIIIYLKILWQKNNQSILSYYSDFAIKIIFIKSLGTNERGQKIY